MDRATFESRKRELIGDQLVERPYLAKAYGCMYELFEQTDGKLPDLEEVVIDAFVSAIGGDADV